MMTSTRPDPHECDTRFVRRYSKLSIVLMVVAGCARGAPLCLEERCSLDVVETTGEAESTGDTPMPEIDPIDAGVDGELLAEQTINILSERCGGCHRSPASSGGIDFITDLGELIETGLVAPSDSDASLLYAKVESGEMPLGGPALPTTELAVIRQWINIGAPVPIAPETCENTFFSYSDLYTMMELDLTTIENEDKPFTRYLSLHDLYNRGACQADLEIAQRVAAKLVNSLSSTFELHRPVQTDDSGVLLRLDLRDYGWEPSETSAVDLWEFAAGKNPYAIKFVGNDGESVNAITTTSFPLQTLSSFLRVTTRAPNYYEFTGFPSQLATFLSVEDIDIGEAQDSGDAVRAGSRVSEVTFFGRIVERVRFAARRTLWLSYDFDSETNDSNILEHPLDAVHRENQLIYTLPNELNAYAVVDATGVRIDSVSLDIMRDPLQRDQTATVGVSCMSCHQTGVSPMADQVRAHVLKFPFLFDAATYETVLDLFVEPALFQKNVEEDNRNLEARHADLGLDFIGQDGIVEAAIKFERDLSLEDFAAELGLDPLSVSNAVNLVDDNLVTLKTGGVISRDIVDATFVRVLCLFQSQTLTVADVHCSSS